MERATIRISLVSLLAVLFFALTFPATAQLRPPSVPLVPVDPYFSIWSASDTLTGKATEHWTGVSRPLNGLLRLDGKTYRWMGVTRGGAAQIPEMEQKELTITPTRTIYRFQAAGVELTVTFLAPALPADLDVLAMPVVYLNLDIHSTDGKSHSAQLYFDATALIAANNSSQPLITARQRLPDLEILRAGTTQQQMLAHAGDNVRIDWGYFYVAVPVGQGPTTTLAGNISTRDRFASSGELPEADNLETAPGSNTNQPILAVQFDLGSVEARPISRWMMLAYDDIYSLEFMDRRLRPYWRRNGATAADLLTKAAAGYPDLRQRTQRFDEELTRDLRQVGGPRYAELAILAYRQAMAAYKLASDIDGTPIYLPKENFSGGFIGTVDVIYPAIPMYLFFNPALVRAQVKPVLDYAVLPRWPWRFAPHDLGVYPLANGQAYGGGEKTEENQMPVEETGNLLIILGALAKVEGNADFSKPYWPLLTKWAEYLKEKGMDPENQLSTDDFAGHLAHNANLSIKATEALACYAELAHRLGHEEISQQFLTLARDMAKQWVGMDADGDHFKLAFDKPGTWSLKYNLVWDKILGLGLFPAEVTQKEIAFYKKTQNKYGIPLDNRETYTKLDWVLWTATLSGNQEDFSVLFDPVYRFANETPNRVPLTDWYSTTDAHQIGFQGRSVVGGVFIKMLADNQLWKKWSSMPLSTDSHLH